MSYACRRETVFGPGRAVPLDRNQKARIVAYARAWSRRHRLEGQHTGPLSRAFLDVLRALLWGFHNAHTGRCFPSYERIAEQAGCARSTVALALKALEFAGVLTWQHRIVRVRELCTDLFGRGGWCWRVVRTSNAYVFASKSENRPGTRSQENSTFCQAAPPGNDPADRALARPETALDKALARLATAIQARTGIEG
jgi:hypothetical protein